MNKILFLLMFLCSCVSGRRYYVPDGQDKAFNKYVKIFEKESGLEFPKDITLGFVDRYLVDSIPDLETVGYCDGDGNITFRRDFWNKITDTSRELVFLHEAGHCIFDYEHDDSVDENGVYNSIMASWYQKEFHEAYEKDRDKYLNRLFPWRNQGVIGTKVYRE